MPINDYLIFIVILASLGNAFVILSLLLNHKTRTSFGAFIINISFVDFLIGGFLKSSFVIEDYMEGQQITETHCFFMTSFITSSPTIVLMCMIVLSLYALCATVKKISLHKLLTAETTFINLFVVWVLGGGMSLIYHGVLGHFSNYCAVDEELLAVSIFANLILMAFLTITHIVIIAIEQMRKLSETIEMHRVEGVYNNLSVELTEEELEVRTHERDTRKTIFILSAIFVLFWMPFYSIRAHFEFTKHHSIELIVVQLIAYIFGYFNSTVTPIAILVFYPESRILLKRIDKEKLMFWKRLKWFGK